MSSQLCINLMIMIKNAYFCVAKAKVDDLIGKIFLILLGTNWLEDIFGILWTMVGNDSTLDLLQLILHLGGTTKVSAILANYPEWDHSPWLKLPAVSKNGMALHKDIDHIKPSAWKGNVYVSKVNLQTCWMRGHQKVKEVPHLDEILKKIEAANNPSVNILQPFGIYISTGCWWLWHQFQTSNQNSSPTTPYNWHSSKMQPWRRKRSKSMIHASSWMAPRSGKVGTSVNASRI